jgi:prolyl 4-hydroxylase
VNYLSRDPLVYTIRDVLSESECDHLIDLAAPHLDFSTVAEAGPDGQKIMGRHPGRTSMNCVLKHREMPRVTRIVNRVSGLIGQYPGHAEDLQVLRYHIGNEYQAHQDAFDPNTVAGKAYIGDSGQRMFTVLGYLSDVDAGGETVFPQLDISVSPERGKLLVFRPCCDYDTWTPDLRTEHAGMPVISGVKWAFNLWYRDRVWVK